MDKTKCWCKYPRDVQYNPEDKEWVSSYFAIYQRGPSGKSKRIKETLTITHCPPRDKDNRSLPDVW